MTDIAQPVMAVIEDMAPLKQRLRSYLRFVLCFSLVGLLVGVAVLAIVPAKYEATAIAASPVDRSGAKIRGDVQPTTSGGILAGLTGASNAPPLLERFQQTLHSRRLADELMKNDEFAHRIFAGQWDAQDGRWSEPHGIVSSIRRTVQQAMGRPVDTMPTGWQLQDYLTRNIVTTTIPKSAAFQIKYLCPDRDFCLQLLEAVISEADGLIRKDVIEHDRSYSTFIANRMRDVTEVNDRQILTTLQSDIRRDEMLADSGVNYSMDLVDGPSVSALPTEPRIGMTLALGLFGGLMLSVILVLTYEGLGVGALLHKLRA